MKELFNLETVTDYGSRVGHFSQHPLVSVIDFSNLKYQPGARALALRFHFYAVFLKQGKNCILRYGRKTYDYQDGTLVFFSPGQVVDISSDGPDYQPSGNALLFHPDLLRGTTLASTMGDYNFFSYEITEALHLSERERQIVLDCFDKIDFELSQGVDKHSKKLIVSNIELFLNYCNRFYDRQFITRGDTENSGILGKFDKMLHEYLYSGKAEDLGSPSVGYFASEFNLSPNYFGDLVKKETGKSALEQIQTKLIEVAKEKIFDPDKSVSQVAYELGFKYPQHFSRLFKQRVGHSPREFRSLN